MTEVHYNINIQWINLEPKAKEKKVVPGPNAKKQMKATTEPKPKKQAPEARKEDQMHGA